MPAASGRKYRRECPLVRWHSPDSVVEVEKGATPGHTLLAAALRSWLLRFSCRRRDEDSHQVHRQLRGICSIHIGQRDYTCFALGKDHEKCAGALLTSAVSYVQFAQTFAGSPSQRIFGCGTICQSLRDPHDIP